jgi:putative ABC transport system substrate-binding protein
MVAAFRLGLQQSGYVEGQNVAIEWRWAHGNYERLPEFAADLVRRQVSVIDAGDTASALAAKSATATIPVVFSTSADSVEIGLVSNLKRPEGNLTGVTNLGADVGPKRLEVLKEAIPQATIMGLLVNPRNPQLAQADTRALLGAALHLGIQLEILHAGTEPDLDIAFASAQQKGVRALAIGTDQFFTTRVQQLAALTMRYTLPAIYQDRVFAFAGGLVSYGASIPENYRLAGVYVGKILEGAQPADLPVQQATKVELVLNLKTAKTFGLSFPLPLLGRADEVIE